MPENRSVCGRGHVVDWPDGTPDEEMEQCPACLEDETVEEAGVPTDTLLEEPTIDPDEIGGPA